MREKKIVHSVGLYKESEERLRKTYEEYGKLGRRSFPEFINLLIDTGLDVIDVERGYKSGAANPTLAAIAFNWLKKYKDAPIEAWKNKGEKEATETPGKNKIIPFPIRSMEHSA